MTLKRYLLLATLFLGVAGSQSCKKEETPAPTPTSLDFTVKDDLGNAVSGATVKLYTSETDFKEQKNQFLETAFTDFTGKVSITGMKHLKYYWYIEKDCKNNFHGGVTTVRDIYLNSANNLDVVLAPTGTIQLTSVSNNPYKIYLNGEYVGDIEAKQTKSFFYKETGSYSIRVLQKSGYTVYPTDETYTGTLNCGATLKGSFPG